MQIGGLTYPNRKDYVGRTFHPSGVNDCDSFDGRIGMKYLVPSTGSGFGHSRFSQMHNTGNSGNIAISVFP